MTRRSGSGGAALFLLLVVVALEGVLSLPVVTQPPKKEEPKEEDHSKDSNVEPLEVSWLIHLSRSSCIVSCCLSNTRTDVGFKFAFKLGCIVWMLYN